MKLMFTLMDEYALRFIEYFKNEDSSNVELKDTFTRNAIDVIATTAFGIECDSFSNKINEFYLMGKGLINTTGLRSLMFLAFVSFPKLMKVILNCYLLIH